MAGTATRCRCSRAPPSRWRSPATTWSSRRASGSRTASAPPPGPLTSVTATRRSATPGTSTSADSPVRPGTLRGFAARSLARVKAWDLEASTRVTHYVANSEITRARIAEFYGRESEVLHPPVEVGRFAIGEPEDYFLYVGELVSHKRAGVAIAAAKLAGRPIRVVGDGPDLAALRAAHGDHATFLGRIGDDELARVYSGALALVVPNVEEFGIASVEAQASGRPVLAVGAGGALETVVDGETGVLTAGGSAGEIAAAMADVDFTRFDPAAARGNAERFADRLFRERLIEIVGRASSGNGV